MTQLRIEPITREALTRFSESRGVECPAWVTDLTGYAVIDGCGEPVGVGGVFRDNDGRWWALLDTPCLYGRATTLHRRAKRLLASVRQAGHRPAVLRDDGIAGSDRWLARLGFAPSGETMNGKEVWA